MTATNLRKEKEIMKKIAWAGAALAIVVFLAVSLPSQARAVATCDQKISWNGVINDITPFGVAANPDESKTFCLDLGSDVRSSLIIRRLWTDFVLEGALYESSDGGSYDIKELLVMGPFTETEPSDPALRAAIIARKVITGTELLPQNYYQVDLGYVPANSRIVVTIRNPSGSPGGGLVLSDIRDDFTNGPVHSEPSSRFKLYLPSIFKQKGDPDAVKGWDGTFGNVTSFSAEVGKGGEGLFRLNLGNAQGTITFWRVWADFTLTSFRVCSASGNCLDIANEFRMGPFTETEPSDPILRAAIIGRKVSAGPELLPQNYWAVRLNGLTPGSYLLVRTTNPNGTASGFGTVIDNKADSFTTDIAAP